MAPSLAEAARAVAAGALVVYPTDTLLGVAARADDPAAVLRLSEAKSRPADQPISVAVSSYEELERLAELGVGGRGYLRTHLPGPYTLLVRPSGWARRHLAPAIARGATIGLRIPDHPVARELARRVGPITATSANRHGTPPARTIPEARRALGASIQYYLPARPAPSGRPSQLVDLTGPEPQPVVRGS